MAKKIIQFRYFGENNTKNFPNTINSSNLASGTVFDGYTPIIKLGIQALPGFKFRLNANLDNIIIGGTGLYELDLTNSSGYITSINFNDTSLALINDKDDGYLIIDLMYEEVE